MMRSNTWKVLGAILVLIAYSCKTYTIPVDSFREQMMEAKPKNRVAVEINNPLAYGNIKYFSNNISQLMVLDKKGNESFLDISPAIEMRVTHKNGKKYLLYFDTVILENDTLKGGRSRFAQGLTRAIPLDSIVKIEVQDGGKKFGYQKQSNIN